MQPAGPRRVDRRAEGTASCGAKQIRKDNIMSNKPTLYAYTVKDLGNQQKPIWTRIGAAWVHGNGNGLTVELRALPLDGRIVLMEPKQDASEDQAKEAA
jgi:hypothetical protein